MENKFLCLMAGYDDDTENHLAGIQKSFTILIDLK